MIQMSKEALLLAERTRQKIEAALYLIYPNDPKEASMERFLNGILMPMAQKAASERNYFNLAKMVNSELRVTDLTELEVCAFVTTMLGMTLSPVSVLVQITERLCGYSAKFSFNFYAVFKNCVAEEMSKLLGGGDFEDGTAYTISREVMQQKTGLDMDGKEAFEILSSIVSYNNIVSSSVKP